MTTMIDRSVFDALAYGKYEFVDLGCGAGGSLDHCMRRFGSTLGLGLELDAELVEEARCSGYDAVVADVTQVELPKHCVRYVSAMDFLEHLADEATAVGVLERLSPAARDFLFIRHPSFEDVDYLEALGFKLCWTDWTGHPNMMRLSDFKRVFERFGWNDYVVIPRLQITDTSHDQVLVLDDPRDVTKFDERLHSPKRIVGFDRPIFSQFDIIVRLNPDMDESAWQQVISSDLGQDAAAWASFASTSEVRQAELHTPPGFYRPSDSLWCLRKVGAKSADQRVSIRYGAPGKGLLPLVGDFDGHGLDGIGLYDRVTGDFFLRYKAAEGLADVAFRFGPPNCIPLAGDWTGAGLDTVGVYLPETGHWFLRLQNSEGNADVNFSFGPPKSNLVPVIGDWNGDGVDSFGLYDAGTGNWILHNGAADGGADEQFVFGPPNAIPVVGDWDGDGVDSIGVYLPESGEWYLRNSNSNGPPDVVFTDRLPGGIPVSGRWDLP